MDIFRAAEEDDLERVKYLIKQGVSVDSRDVFDFSPLHCAVACDRYELAKLLISKKCDMNIKNNLGLTPVMLAVSLYKNDIAHLLLQSGAQVNIFCYGLDGPWTVLHFACQRGMVDVMQHILQRGGEVNAALGAGDTPLMLAARCGWSEKSVEFLIMAGADVNQSNQRKITALFVASNAGHSKVVQLLLQVEGLNLNPQNDRDETPLHRACWWGHQEVVKQLLIAGADTNIKNCCNETAFSVGIKRGRLTLEDIRSLVQRGAFLEGCDYEQISKDPVLKELVLKDVDICTQLLLNKFHRQSLPALIPNFAEKLPCIKKIKLHTQQMQDVENFVTHAIQTNKICNIVKASPIVLSMLCTRSLIAHQTGRKRSASPGFSDSRSALKKPRHN